MMDSITLRWPPSCGNNLPVWASNDQCGSRGRVPYRDPTAQGAADL